MTDVFLCVFLAWFVKKSLGFTFSPTSPSSDFLSLCSALQRGLAFLTSQNDCLAFLLVAGKHLATFECFPDSLKATVRSCKNGMFGILGEDAASLDAVLCASALNSVQIDN